MKKITISLLAFVSLGLMQLNTYAQEFVMGTGTEWSHWNVKILENGQTKNRRIHEVLKEMGVPTKAMKTYLNSYTDMSYFQELLDDGIQPVMIEENPLAKWFDAEYPQGNTWDDDHVWNSKIEAKWDAYIRDVIKPRIANMKKLKTHGRKIYYVLNPEFVFVGNLPTSVEYREHVENVIELFRDANIPNLRIVRGMLINPGDFNSYKDEIQTYVNFNRDMIRMCDYFAPAFHNQNKVNANVAADMIDFLEWVKNKTGKKNFISHSYIRWNTVYDGRDAPKTPTGSDNDAVKFWNYMRTHSSELKSRGGVVGWVLSATFEARGGTGFVEPQVRPSGFTGYPYPFDENGTFNRGGVAFIEWMSAEAGVSFPPPGVSGSNMYGGGSSSGGSSSGSSSSGGSSGEAYNQMKNRQSRKCAAVENGSTANYTNIVQATCNSSHQSQQWDLKDIGNGYFHIKNRKSGKCMRADGGNVVQYTCHNDYWTEMFSRQDASSGYRIYKNRNTNKCLRIESSSSSDGASIVFHECNTGYYSEQFILQ